MARIPRKFERKILHFDGDSFFASVEQVMDWQLKGKPLVTGGERGAITSASLEAKKLGINRGISMQDAKYLVPELIIVDGDYLSYSIFAHRMYRIVKKFTDIVEEYSIDECFADITGLDKVYKCSYEELALKIKRRLEESLGLTFGVGLGPSKVLAKVASKHRKPAGFTVVTSENLPGFLQTLPVGKVWGIGPASATDLAGKGIQTAQELVEKPANWAEKNLAKPYREIWLELQGYLVKELNLTPEAPKSIIHSRTFRPPSTKRDFIYSELSKNVEAACTKARRVRVKPKDFRFFLKTQQFTYQSFEVSMPLASSSPTELMKWVEQNFDKVYKPKVLYRATGVTLKNFEHSIATPDLFGNSEMIENQKKVFEAVDKISRRYGEHSVSLASSLNAKKRSGHTPHKTLDLPFLGIVK